MTKKSGICYSFTLLMTTIYDSSLADGICHNTWLQYSKDSSVPVCICHATNDYSIGEFSVCWYICHTLDDSNKRQLSCCRYLSICHSTNNYSIGEFRKKNYSTGQLSVSLVNLKDVVALIAQCLSASTSRYRKLSVNITVTLYRTDVIIFGSEHIGVTWNTPRPHS